LIKVDDIKEKKNLTKAIKTDYIFFFNKMINNRLRKVIGNNWDIYLKDSINVYYGYSILTKKGLYTDTIYSVNKFELENEIPLYDKLEFWDIRGKCLDYAYQDYNFGDNYQITYANDSIVMTPDGILINTQRKYKSQKANHLKRTKGQVQFKIMVNKTNLELISKTMIK
jgi:hypothetical protein